MPRQSWFAIFTVLLAIAPACSGGSGGESPVPPSKGKSTTTGGGTPAEPVKRARVRLRSGNGSKATGTATLSLQGTRLTLSLKGSGVVPSQEHLLRLHRRPGGARSTCPPASADADRNKIVNVREGVRFHGPSILALKPFPKADAGGRISYSKTRQVKDAKLLDGAVLILSGAKPNKKYKPRIPVACGQVSLK